MWLSLPQEIKLYIFYHLPPVDLLYSLPRVNREFSSLAKTAFKDLFTRDISSKKSIDPISASSFVSALFLLGKKTPKLQPLYSQLMGKLNLTSLRLSCLKANHLSKIFWTNRSSIVFFKFKLKDPFITQSEVDHLIENYIAHCKKNSSYLLHYGVADLSFIIKRIQRTNQLENLYHEKINSSSFSKLYTLLTEFKNNGLDLDAAIKLVKKNWLIYWLKTILYCMLRAYIALSNCIIMGAFALFFVIALPEDSTLKNKDFILF